MAGVDDGPVLEAKPEIVFVALGSPKQEAADRTPSATPPAGHVVALGVGISFQLSLWRQREAAPPGWDAERRALEWVHRLVAGARVRLFKRYLVHGIPFRPMRLMFRPRFCRGDRAQVEVRPFARPDADDDAGPRGWGASTVRGEPGRT